MRRPLSMSSYVIVVRSQRTSWPESASFGRPAEDAPGIRAAGADRRHSRATPRSAPSRELLERGEFERLVREHVVTGATSNPTIFANAITGSDRHGQLRSLATAGIEEPEELFFALALDDIARAADLLRSVYDASGGGDGFVSFECNPVGREHKPFEFADGGASVAQ
jgi:hypothetical protein